MTKAEKKKIAQNLIMDQIAKIGYGDDYEEFRTEIGDDEEAVTILKEQMDRVAKMFGFREAWFV